MPQPSFNADAIVGSHSLVDSYEKVSMLRPAPPFKDDSETHTVATVHPTAIVPRAAPRPRVVFITPNLLIGGVEHWLLGVSEHSGSQLEWSVAVTNPAAIEPEMRVRVEAFACVDTGDDGVARLLRTGKESRPAADDGPHQPISNSTGRSGTRGDQPGNAARGRAMEANRTAGVHGTRP